MPSASISLACVQLAQSAVQQHAEVKTLSYSATTLAPSPSPSLRFQSSLVFLYFPCSPRSSWLQLSNPSFFVQTKPLASRGSFGCRRAAGLALKTFIYMHSTSQPLFLVSSDFISMHTDATATTWLELLLIYIRPFVLYHHQVLNTPVSWEVLPDQLHNISLCQTQFYAWYMWSHFLWELRALITSQDQAPSVYQSKALLHFSGGFAQVQAV